MPILQIIRPLIRFLVVVMVIGVFHQTSASGPDVDVDWYYDVTAEKGANELAIMATFPQNTPIEFFLVSGAESYIRDVEIEKGKDWVALSRQGDSWASQAANANQKCRIRYRFLLAEAANNFDDFELAGRDGEALFAPPSTWLLRPKTNPAGHTIRCRVKTPPGLSFVSGLFPPPVGAKETFETPASLVDMSYSAFGAFRTRKIEVPGGLIEVAVEQSQCLAVEPKIIQWITSSAKSVATYYGKFPVPRALVVICSREGEGIESGTTIGNGGAAIVISVGCDTTQKAFDTDWVMTHEMVHTAFPSVSRHRHAWVEEGIATYVEPLARLQAGKLTPEQVWKELVRNVPKGQPQPGDRGLDYTPTWGRTYWGGALFFLQADIEIRKRTENRQGLGDALRGIVAAGGTVNADWDLVRAFKEGDKATGVPVLMELYNQMRAKPVTVDLATLWSDLGVKRRGGSVVFDDQAPLANIRRAISQVKPTGHS